MSGYDIDMDNAAVFARGNLQRIGIMGGTFDPVHYGHLVTAEGARFEFNLDRVIFVPSGRPPHKRSQKITGAYHRLAMTRLAVASNSFFDVSPIEVEREGVSYTIDTIREMHSLYPNAQIFFITGADAVLEILTWKDLAELFDLCYFIAATRPGYQLENLKERLDILPGQQLKKVSALVVPALAISSTDIRRRISEGQPVKYLLPEEVERYIYREELYHNL